jgi:hypothetical protein
MLENASAQAKHGHSGKPPLFGVPGNSNLILDRDQPVSSVNEHGAVIFLRTSETSSRSY